MMISGRSTARRMGQGWFSERSLTQSLSVTPRPTFLKLIGGVCGVCLVVRCSSMEILELYLK